jgi:SsrA-binding protein
VTQAATDDKRVIVRNKRAYHDYIVESTFEAGLALVGSEVKSIRDGKVVIGDAWVTVRNNEAWLVDMQVNEYPWANRWNHQPKRERKLLLKRREIEKLGEAVNKSSYTALALELYFLRGRVKALIGVCRGKKEHDKRQTERERDARREIDAALARRRKK